MARKTAGLSYAEDTTGTFGSGWTPGTKTGGFPAAGRDSPVAPSKFDNSQPTGGKSLYPQGGKPVAGVGAESPEMAQARILGTTPKVSPQRTVQQMMAQNDFDRRNGFQPTHSDADIKRLSNYVNPAVPQPASTTPGANSSQAAAAVPGMSASPLNTLSNPLTIGAPISPATGTALLSTPGAPGLPQTPQIGRETDPTGLGTIPVRAVAGAVSSGAGKVGRFLNPAGAEPATSDPTGIQSAVPAVKGAALAVGGALNPGGGDAIPSGVSNATAAQFEKPTAANPVPTTPTTPTADIDKSDASLSKFGVDDDELRKMYDFGGKPLAQTKEREEPGPDEDVPPGAPSYNRGPLTTLPAPTPTPTPPTRMV
jgi:hypothetical protein